MTSSAKTIAIDLLETAEVNLLYSFIGIKPEEVYKQVHPEFNSIMWILGHCAAHLHMVLCRSCQEMEIISKDTTHYFRYGTTKEEISQSDIPMTFSQLIDEYLKISDSGFAYLRLLQDEDLEKIIIPLDNENLLQAIKRVALHFMGHMGQIVLLRRALGNPGPTFVGGVKESNRREMRKEWEDWWTERRDDFKI